MTKEADAIAKAFYAGKRKSLKRTHTDGECVTLFGTVIAWRDDTGMVYVSLADYPTVTTRDRINAILDVYGVEFRVRQRKGCQYRWDFRNQSLEEWYDPMPLAGPLGMMVLEAERRTV